MDDTTVQTTKMNNTATAMVWHGGDRFVPTVLPLPTLAPGEAIVRVTAATICQSDRHTVAGRRTSPMPSILGHEGVGVIQHNNGARDVYGTELRIGDRVVWSVISHCGQCDRCRRGLSAKCRSLKKTGHELFAPSEDSWALSGTYATHMVLRAGQAVVKVGDALSDAVASTAACAGATVMAAIEAAGASMDRAGSMSGQRVLVNGVGMLGVFAVGAAKRLGAECVQACDFDQTRLDIAMSWGADEAVFAGEAPLCPVDVALEFSGHPAGVRTVFDALHIGGSAVLVGSVSPGPSVPVDPEWLVRGWRSIAGVHNYEPRHLVQAVRFLEAYADDLPWEGIVGESIGFGQLAAAFEENKVDDGSVVAGGDKSSGTGSSGGVKVPAHAMRMVVEPQREFPSID